MKKVIIVLLLSFSFIIFPFTGKVSAAEMSVGASTWYCWWDSTEEDMNLKPSFLYGPVLSTRFDDSWSLAGVFLYGKFYKKDKDIQEGPPDGVSRFDSDLSLNYNISRYFKIFCGGKFMGFFYKTGNGGNGEHWSAGPGLGIGSTLPLTQSLYLLFNVSGTYSRGKHVDTESNLTRTNKLTERGFNTNLSFAYYFASASTSLNLGFRYQYVFIDYLEETNNKDQALIFYGPTLSVVYSF